MTTDFSAPEQARLMEAATWLRKAERGVRVLRTIAWPPEVGERFIAGAGREIPSVRYEQRDPSQVLADVAEAEKRVDGASPVHHWLTRVAGSIATGARMLAAVGTRDFYRYSAELYGTPSSVLADGVLSPIDLARHLNDSLDLFSDQDFYPAPAATLSAQEVQRALHAAVHKHFGDDAPVVEVVDHLSAKALAGARYIRVRQGAVFSDRDVLQLIHHEALVHVATTLNGVAQKSFPILGGGHPGTTRTQEGLAVFAEFISGSMAPDRLRRLADRVIAIQMAIDGADFLEVYRFFAARCDAPQAFENTRRVFRGGVLTGGAPFTKDGVYIEGLLRVHNFLHTVVHKGRIDCLHLLFAGKLDIEDLPALEQLSRAGLCTPPRYLPPWARDMRFLTSYLAYSAFLNRIDLAAVRQHYDGLLGPPAHDEG